MQDWLSLVLCFNGFVQLSVLFLFSMRRYDRLRYPRYVFVSAPQVFLLAYIHNVFIVVVFKRQHVIFNVDHKVKSTGFSRSALALPIQRVWDNRILFLLAGVARLAGAGR